MKILYLEWNSFGNEDMYEVLERLGSQVIRFPFTDNPGEKETQQKSIKSIQVREKCNLVFSFNYFPFVSEVCMELGIKYVSWVYDSPYMNLYSYTMLNTCNYVFIFDYAQYAELSGNGLKTVYYMPMGVHTERLDKWDKEELSAKEYKYDISFVGSLYTEKKHRLYDRIQNMDSFSKGYLDGVIQAQLKVQGYNFLQEVLTEDILQEMQKVYPLNPEGTTVASPRYVYGDYVLSRQVTALERKRILEILGEKDYRIALFTHDTTVRIPGIQNRGPVDYYKEMPGVFRESKINLNITLRSIRTGIPLRAMDIMGAGGFLLTNYQEEFFQYFIPGEDFIYYEEEEDLLEKIEYYLSHETERREIAENGHRKIREAHTMYQRVREILEIVEGKGRVSS